jgi:hypothetical protein
MNKKGNHKAVGRTLRNNMYPDDSHTEHPYWHDVGTWAQEDVGQYNYRLYKKPSLEAHHLIPGAAMKTGGWKKTCKDLKYDINTKFNGVMFPNWISLACHAKVPLHRGGHDHKKNPSKYSNYTELLIKKTKLNFKRMNNQCDSDRFITEMNDTSYDIFEKISKFKFLLIKDGKDYHPAKKKGCCQDGKMEIVYSSEKQRAEKKGNITCIKRRKHWYKSIEVKEKIEFETGRKFFHIGS